MKVRQNKRRILTNLRWNNLHIWFVAKCIRGHEKIRERNERIKKLVDNM